MYRIESSDFPGGVLVSPIQKYTSLRRLLLLCAAVTFSLPGCGDDTNPVVNPDGDGDPGPGATIDTIPPADITALLLKYPTSQAVFLVWTAPGDDGGDGTATEYDIRYTTAPLSESNWESAIQYGGETAPREAGQPETVKITNLLSVTTYYFGIKTRDEAGNESGLSNIVSGTTLQEAQPPARISDLEVVTAGPDAFRLTWTAPGDDGVFGNAAAYDIRYHTSPITPSTWRYAKRIPPPQPAASGATQTLLAENIPGDDVYWFAMKACDEVPNWSVMSNVENVIGERILLYLPVTDFVSGEEATIHFRAPGNRGVSIRVHRFMIDLDCRPAGTHPWVYLDIVNNKVYPKGAYTVTTDFTYPNGDYLATAGYFIVMCWGGETQEYKSIDFINNELSPPKY